MHYKSLWNFYLGSSWSLKGIFKQANKALKHDWTLILWHGINRNMFELRHKWKVEFSLSDSYMSENAKRQQIGLMLKRGEKHLGLTFRQSVHAFVSPALDLHCHICKSGFLHAPNSRVKHKCWCLWVQDLRLKAHWIQIIPLTHPWCVMHSYSTV